jgi:hypothetical protein
MQVNYLSVFVCALFVCFIELFIQFLEIIFFKFNKKIKLKYKIKRTKEKTKNENKKESKNKTIFQ